MPGPARWTGREALLLRTALRMSLRTFAAYLGVGERTVSKWEKGGTSTTPRPDTQAILDTALAQAAEAAQVRFAQLLNSQGVPETASNDDEGQHLKDALADASRYLDHEVVNHFGRELDRCEVLDGSLGPLAALPAVLGILGAIRTRAEDTSPAVRRGLLSVGARGAEFIGWLYRDLHQPQRAILWYGRATEWAQEAGDLPMQGYVLLRKSQMAYEERDAVRVLTLAQAANYGPWNLAPHIRAEIVHQEARGLAMLGEPLDDVRRKLGEAGDLLSDASSPANHILTLREASCYLEAGRPRLAAQLYLRVLSSGELSPRDRGYFLARSTSALALAGEPDEAATTGVQAATAAAAIASERTRRELSRALVTLTPWQHRPGTQALREALRNRP